MRSRLQRTIIAALTLTLLFPASVSSQAGGTPPPGEVSTGADNARAKIHEDLAAELDEAPADREIWFAGHAATGVNLDAYTDRWFARPDLGLGVVGIIGYATPAEVVKIASDANVLQLQLPKSIFDVPKPADGDAPGILNTDITPAINQQPGPGPAPEGWYHTGSAIHGSQQAWDKNFTGRGVVYMSNDSRAELTVETCCTAGGSDIDLYVYGPDGNLLASSTTATDEEFVTIRFPADGDYTIAVHGWAVTGGSDTFELTVNAVQGTDLSASAQSGPVNPGQVKQVTVSWDLSGVPSGVYTGVVLLGPPDAPGLITVPVEITVGGGGSR